MTRTRGEAKTHDLIITIPADLPAKVEAALIAILHGLERG